MKHRTYQLALLASFISLWGLPEASIATSSTDIRVANVQTPTRTVVHYDCKETEEVKYTVTMWRMHAAYPECPTDYTMEKINFRTQHYMSDVDTYISLRCCKSKAVWKTDNA